jgi:hypothetical protein
MLIRSWFALSCAGAGVARAAHLHHIVGCMLACDTDMRIDRLTRPLHDTPPSPPQPFLEHRPRRHRPRRQWPPPCCWQGGVPRRDHMSRIGSAGSSSCAPLPQRRRSRVGAHTSSCTTRHKSNSLQQGELNLDFVLPICSFFPSPLPRRVNRSWRVRTTATAHAHATLQHPPERSRHAYA